MFGKVCGVVLLLVGYCLSVSVALDRPRRQTMDAAAAVASAKYDSGYGGGSYGGYGNGGYGGGGYGGYGGGGYGGGGYGMMGGGGKDKDYGLETILGIAIPIGLGLLALPLLLLLVGPILAAALAFFIGRSSSGGDGGVEGGDRRGLPDLNLLQSIHEAFSAYRALSTSDECRKRVVCEVGYIIRRSDKRSIIIAILDTMTPKMFQGYFEPLKESLRSVEGGKCQKYVCDANLTKLFHNPSKKDT